jgi:hypothetical protein
VSGRARTGTPATSRRVLPDRNDRTCCTIGGSTPPVQARAQRREDLRLVTDKVLINLRPDADSTASTYSAPNLAKRSVCSTTIVVTSGSRSNVNSFLRRPFSADPTSVTTRSTGRLCPVAQVVPAGEPRLNTGLTHRGRPPMSSPARSQNVNSSQTSGCQD